jgi:hypothetical protein
MINNLKTMPFAEAFFQILKLLFNKLDHLTALNAPEVAVVTITVNGLVMHMPILVPDLPYQTALGNERDIPVDGGLGNPRSLLAQPDI